MTEDRTAVHVDEFLPHPPRKVWDALTDPDLMARWLMPNDFKPVVGHRFTLTAKANPRTGFSGTVRCEVLELRPVELLSISWADADEGNAWQTVVTWTLRPGGPRHPAVPRAPRVRPGQPGASAHPRHHGRRLAHDAGPSHRFRAGLVPRDPGSLRGSGA